MVNNYSTHLMVSAMFSAQLLVNYMRITLVVSIYWIISISTVFVNKNLLSHNDIKLDIPYTILWFQCFISVLICLIFRFLSNSDVLNINFPHGSPFKMKSVCNILPISVLMTSMIVFNALCLKNVGVSFYYIGRSLTTVFNVLLTYIILKKTISVRTISCCIVIIIGFLLGIDQENLLGTFSIYGTLSGLMASLSLALYSVYNKKVLPHVNDSIWLLSYYNNVYSCILLFPLMLLNGEMISLSSTSSLITEYNFWTKMVIGGICGFSMGYVTSLQIQVTSPLTHNVSGTAKACVQTLIATIWFREVKTVLWWISNYVVLIGSFAYARVKQIEMEEKFEESCNKQLLKTDETIKNVIQVKVM